MCNLRCMNVPYEIASLVIPWAWLAGNDQSKKRNKTICLQSKVRKHIVAYKYLKTWHKWNFD